MQNNNYLFRYSKTLFRIFFCDLLPLFNKFKKLLKILYKQYGYISS